MNNFLGKKGESLSHLTMQTTNPQIAATIIAIDVPLLKSAPMKNFVGDGLKAPRITWHFAGASPTGNTASMVIDAWYSDAWLQANPTHTVAKIKRAFEAMKALAQQAKGRDVYVDRCMFSDTICTASTPQAATMIALGHPCFGYTLHAGSYFWHFNRTADADMALWEDKLIHEKLPSEDLSYIKTALLNWRQLLTDIKIPTHTAVQHGRRTAYVGRDDDAKAQSQIEKLLYRK